MIFDKLNKKREETKIKAERKKREEEKKRILKLNKLREEYLELSPVYLEDIIGMRVSKYEIDASAGKCRRGKLMEFFSCDAKNYILADEDLSRWDNYSVVAPDSIDDVAEALSRYIPRFEDGEKIVLKYDGYSFRGLRSGCVDLRYNANYAERFINCSNAKELSLQQYKKLMSVIEAWNEKGLLQIVGRDVYDPWKTKLKPFSKIINEDRKKAEEKEENEKKWAEEKFKNEQMAKIKKAKEDRDNAIIEAGKKGEEEVNYALKWLDKRFILVDDSSIQIKNSSFMDEAQEFDKIIVGPVGVILIEVKAYSGKIIIDEGGNWRRNKSGNEWIGETNPLQQVRRHEKLMKSILNDEIQISSILCLANNSVIIEGTENTPLDIVKCDLLVEEIENMTVDTNYKELNDQQIKDVVSLIRKYIV